MRILTILLLFLTGTTIGFSQIKDDGSTYDYSTINTYELGGLTITGAETRDRTALKSITGLRVGETLTIPGDDIPNAIKALWKLRLFDDVQIIQDKIEGNVIFLEVILRERPTYSKHSFKGVKKLDHDDLNGIVTDILSKGSIVTDDKKNLVVEKIKEFYIDKGFLDVDLSVQEKEDKTKENAVSLLFDIQKNDRIKIDQIYILGNVAVSNWKLKQKLKETKENLRAFKKSKFKRKDYEIDKKNIIAFYNTKGYKDAKIVKDSIWRNFGGKMIIQIELEEGNVFKYRNISWKGNSKYTDDQLTNILGIYKGDTYNSELMEKRLRFSLDGRDVSSLYLDDGYLFFDIQPVEVAIENDSIDIEMRIYEGPQATIDKVEIAGNDRTNEHVIRRELRTLPGKKFSRSDIIRSQREITNLGYFNPENLDIQTPVNQERGTVDILYGVEERPSDQLELSAGYGGFSGLIGTLGVTFNNFSIRNFRDRSSWNPLPQGDGQKFSIRAQSNSRYFKSFNTSFTEPWLGGKKPNALTVGASYSDFDYRLLNQGRLNIFRGFIGLGRQLKWPDDFFSSSTTLTFENISLNNYSVSRFFVDDVLITDGEYKNISIKQVFSRSSISEPIFPRRGSRISLAMQFTPPYSLFYDQKNEPLTESEKSSLTEKETRLRGPANPPTDADMESIFSGVELSRKFEYLEYHKWRFDAEWYYNIVDKLVIMMNAKMGMVGYYDEEIGIGPFERFELGGDGLSNQNVGITGKDIISLRGYDPEDLAVNDRGGASIFDKFTVELRYPLSLNPSSTIYVHGFVQGGNSWVGLKNFNPFELQRSAGGGLRVFLPMFGLLGFDYGWGFDKTANFGKFSIVLGFEPD